LVLTEGSNSWEIYINNNDLNFNYEASNKVMILDSGNVGIGTTNPPQALTIEGNVSASGYMRLGTVAPDPGTVSAINVGLGSGGALRINSDTGYVDIGSQNSGYCHFNTDRPAYYFEKNIIVNASVSPYADNSDNLGTTNEYWANAYIRNLHVSASIITTGSLEIAGDIIPAIDDTYNIGSASYR
jgi:hypothetical protein